MPARYDRRNDAVWRRYVRRASSFESRRNALAAAATRARMIRRDCNCNRAAGVLPYCRLLVCCASQRIDMMLPCGISSRSIRIRLPPDRCCEATTSTSAAQSTALSTSCDEQQLLPRVDQSLCAEQTQRSHSLAPNLGCSLLSVTVSSLSLDVASFSRRHTKRWLFALAI